MTLPACMIFCSVADVRNESDLTCTLDSGRQLTLMLCAYARYTAGKYLRPLGNELLELCCVLIVDEINLVGAELADLLASADLTLCGTVGTGSAFCVLFCCLNSFNFISLCIHCL